MRNVEWPLAVVASLAATLGTGCGGCQQQAPPPAVPVQERAVAPAATPTARTLPTAAEAPEAVTGRAPEPAAEAPPMANLPQEELTEEDLGEEADCVVIADADPDFGVPPLTVHLSVEYECADDQVQLTWDFGDGSAPSSEAAPTHTYTRVGEFIATITVTTPDGATASDEIDISVEEDSLGGEQ